MTTLNIEAERRVRAYLDRRYQAHALDTEHIHGFDVGPDCGFELLVSDLESLLAARSTYPAPQQNVLPRHGAGATSTANVPVQWVVTLERIANWLDSSAKMEQLEDGYVPASEFDWELVQNAAEIHALLRTPIPATLPEAAAQEGDSTLEEGCKRSHPHEDMDEICEQKTVEARHGAGASAPAVPVDWQDRVTEAYVCLRRHNSSIPDDTLDAMMLVLRAATTLPEAAAQDDMCHVCSGINGHHDERCSAAAPVESVSETQPFASSADTSLSTKLWCDLKSDAERSNWLLLGRGYETGVVAKALQNDLAMAYHRLSLRATPAAAVELPPFPLHPDFHTYQWTEAEERVIKEYARAAVALAAQVEKGKA